ncbi:hypothetical protein NUW54_g13868 [Trametes sanguinea]|uniref:Uncharacterized protein n=1 Tax=Trametes sanguinea TaxID=158606 RepID=A0ACC1MIZ1_9APHY|nr:hypothetical protein NUW54_g13868 [Trametes sanguinea]
MLSRRLLAAAISSAYILFLRSSSIARFSRSHGRALFLPLAPLLLVFPKAAHLLNPAKVAAPRSFLKIPLLPIDAGGFAAVLYWVSPVIHGSNVHAKSLRLLKQSSPGIAVSSFPMSRLRMTYASSFAHGCDSGLEWESVSRHRCMVLVMFGFCLEEGPSPGADHMEAPRSA